MNEELRTKCKLLKAIEGITFKELSQYLEIKQNSFYCWLKGYYNLSSSKQSRLEEIISTLKGV